jgi:hypothetical protein
VSPVPLNIIPLHALLLSLLVFGGANTRMLLLASSALYSSLFLIYHLWKESTRKGVFCEEVRYLNWRQLVILSFRI